MSAAVVDLGKTRCRVRVAERSAGSGGAPGLSTTHGVEAALSSIHEAVSGLGGVPVDQISVGAAGAFAAPSAAQELADRLRAAYGASVAVTSDAITAHLGALGGAPGVVVVAGTGAVAVAVSPTGEVAVADGLGPELGDRGSGAWLGTSMLGEASRTPGWESVVLRRLGPDWRALVGDRSYDNAQRRASLVPDLADLARSGDAAASELFGAAARELAATVREAATQVAIPVSEASEVALVGGLSGLGELLLDPLERALAPMRLREASGSALDGAALLLERRDLPHEHLVHRA
ncbi:BadF/BadG/BcrA/BcrD ATPase family protein [Luteipulveratus mongoliensis]|uniref:ATPase BadF/BadG/BcrA/BcrD type domain-containing protein n=1 Tax=Luteipulveratus mongoliensis TaxID=571913 RepID=A0A0K1JDL9_9MICO|nr:BadF/BadG/BcrA/BcrD ATPase family protein [Luteipulveratus mongoliensis]AKU14794.1 hypothetical protein VV02_01090 [Luteipulveratus mongoliensis]